MALEYHQIHLDMRVVPTSVTYNAGTDTSTITLPCRATCNRIVRLATGTMGVLTQSQNLSGVITGISVANPTIITDAGHGLVTGRTITVTGSNSTPSINGTHIVTVISTNTFSIPVNVTVSGSAGAWTSSSHTVFTVPGNFTGGSVVGNLSPFSLELTEPIARGEQGEPDLFLAVVIDRMTLYHLTATGFVVRITSTNDTLWPDRTLTWTTSLLTDPTEPRRRTLIPVHMAAERCTVLIEEEGYKPVQITGIDYELQTMEAPR